MCDGRSNVTAVAQCVTAVAQCVTAVAVRRQVYNASHPDTVLIK
jgi:hypothetical protein